MYKVIMVGKFSNVFIILCFTKCKKIIMRKPELECYFEELESEFVDVSFLDRIPESIRKDMEDSGMFKNNGCKEKAPSDKNFDPMKWKNDFVEPEEELVRALENGDVKVIWKHIRLRSLSVKEKLKIIELNDNGLIWGILRYQSINPEVQEAIAEFNNRDFFEELLKAESLSVSVQLLIVKSKDFGLIKKLLSRGSSVQKSVQKEIVLSCNQRLISILIDKKCLSISNQRLLYHCANSENLLKYKEKGGYSYEALKSMRA